MKPFKTSLTFLANVLVAVMCSCHTNDSGQSTQIVSRVVVDSIDHSRMPSYCDARNYTIAKVNGKFIAKLPAGTVIDAFDNLEDAQKEINKYVEYSRKRYLEYGGY